MQTYILLARRLIVARWRADESSSSQVLVQGLPTGAQITARKRLGPQVGVTAAKTTAAKAWGTGHSEDGLTTAELSADFEVRVGLLIQSLVIETSLETLHCKQRVNGRSAHSAEPLPCCTETDCRWE